MLSCLSGFDDDYGDGWYFYIPNDFSVFDKKRRKRCCSCRKLISLNDICVCFERNRPTRSDVEERIYGDEIPLAPYYLCEKCGEIYYNLHELEYDTPLGENMQDLLAEYRKMTGFKPNPKNKEREGNGKQ